MLVLHRLTNDESFFFYNCYGVYENITVKP